MNKIATSLSTTGSRAMRLLPRQGRSRLKGSAKQAAGAVETYAAPCWTSFVSLTGCCRCQTCLPMLVVEPQGSGCTVGCPVTSLQSDSTHARTHARTHTARSDH